ncbi:hypothetical protein D3C78_1839580 [compost metagenome]
MQDLLGRIANQLGLIGETQLHVVVVKAAQLETQLAVKRHVINKDFANFLACGFKCQWCGRHKYPFFSV